MKQSDLLEVAANEPLPPEQLWVKKLHEALRLVDDFNLYSGHPAGSVVLIDRLSVVLNECFNLPFKRVAELEGLIKEKDMEISDLESTIDDIYCQISALEDEHA